jgi:hypothetical protein
MIVDRQLDELDQLCLLGVSLLEAEFPPISRAVLNARGVRLEARASAAVLARLPTSFPPSRRDPRDVVCFATLSDAALSVGWMADAFVDDKSGRLLDVGWTVLVGVTQQVDQPLDGIPRGWKTLVTLRFLEGLPSCVAGLPGAEEWGEPVRLLWCRRRDHARVERPLGATASTTR